MQPIVTTYLIYLAISLGLTVWVARTLFGAGRAFLLDVFSGNEALADSVNKLLVVGFYLINLGYVALHMRISGEVTSTQVVVEMLSAKLGVVLLVLGAMHFGNLLVFSRWRRHALAADLPPVEPDGFLPTDPAFCAPNPA